MDVTSDAEKSGATTRGLDLSWDHPDNDNTAPAHRDESARIGSAVTKR